MYICRHALFDGFRICVSGLVARSHTCIVVECHMLLFVETVLWLGVPHSHGLPAQLVLWILFAAWHRLFVPWLVV